MEVYLLYSNWMHNGDNAVNEVIGIYDCLQKAQQSMADCINTDLQYHPYDHISFDGDNTTNYNIPELATMFYDEPEFKFDVCLVKLWDGNDEECCETYQLYSIENRMVL